MPHRLKLKKNWLPQPLFSLRLRSADAFDELNARNGFAIDFHVRGANRADLSLEGGQCLTMGLWQTTSATGYTTRPKVQADVFTIRFVTKGWMLRRNRGEEHVGRAGYAMLVPFEDMQSATTSTNYAALSGIISRDTLLASHRALEGDAAGFPDLEPVAPTDTPAMRSFMMSFRRLQDRLRRTPVPTDLVFPLLEEVLAYQLLSLWPRRGSAPVPPPPSPLAALQRACDYVEAHLSQPLRLADLAEVAGTSVRSLQHAFKRELGLTPVEFIQERRLQSVRVDLCRADTAALTIGDVARRWGFDHAGDFGQRFRKRFGCTPSETRRDAPPAE